MNRAPPPVTLRQLQYVVAVADLGNFRRAAAECRVAQPSLSAQLAQAEEQLGVRIFERDRRRVVVTAGGQAIVERARKILREADELVAAAHELSDPLAGTLRLGVIPTVGPYLLPDIAPALRRRFPKIQTQWIEDRTRLLVDRLERGELDGAIVALETDIGDLEHVVLCKDPFVVAAPPDHALARAKPPLSPSDLDGEDVLLLEDGHCFRDQALAVCTRGGAHEGGFRATSLTTLVQMAAGDGGVTLLPSLAVPVENRRHELRILPFGPRGPSRTIALAWRRGSSRAKTLKLVGAALAETVSAAQRPRRA
jgi:LysR family hydrogen peroxide-inducible transcriptional activator